MTGTGKATVEMLQGLLDAFNAHDLNAVTNFFADDALLEMPRGPDPWGRRLQGREEVRSGERVEVRGCDLFDFRGDKITRKDSYWKLVER